MARAALLERVVWRVCTVAGLRDETPGARTIVLDAPDWPGNFAGQHVDVRLTADDGYSTVRSYSIASAAGAGQRIEITVERLDNGEVSPYLTQDLATGDKLEILGPIGGWFVWRPEEREAIQLIAGGSGIVPLMAMMRTRIASGNEAPFKLLYSVRTPEAVLYRDELQSIADKKNGITIEYAYTRKTPERWPYPAHRIDGETVARTVWPANTNARCYICGPTAFVDSASALLTSAGYTAETIRTERFGPSGEHQ